MDITECAQDISAWTYFPDTPHSGHVLFPPRSNLTHTVLYQYHYGLLLTCVYISGSLLPARRHAGTVFAVVACLSVCLSVTSRSCTKMAKHRITQTTPYNSPWGLQFYVAKDLYEIPMGLPPTGRQKQMV